MARTAQQIRQRNAKNGTLRLDRHSGNGRPGAPKKGGAGAKYTWGTPGSMDESMTLDRMDPNYDSDEDVSLGQTK